MAWKIVGVIAATLTCLAFIPQAIKIFKTKSAKDVSIITLLWLSLGVFLWILYGVHIKDGIVITANAVTLLILAVLLVLCFNYGREKL
jgi:MtN3 and saliva related transmembrane protein